MSDNAIAQDIVYAMTATSNGGLCLAASQSGLRRSDDVGKTWYSMNLIPEQSQQPPVTAVALSSSTNGALHLFAGVLGGVFISKDSGTSWTATGLASPPPFVTALAVSPNYDKDGIAFAATMDDGVFRTDNGGQTWQSWCFGLFDLNVLGLAVSPDFGNDRTLYALTETGIYLSKNGGRSWQLTNFPADVAPVLCMAISPDFAQDGKLYAGTEAAGLYYSENRGQTWQPVPLPDSNDAMNAILLGTHYPDKPEILVVTNHALWYSDDAGESWVDWHGNLDFGVGLTVALAPKGFRAGNPLLLGRADGHILTIS